MGLEVLGHLIDQHPLVSIMEGAYTKEFGVMFQPLLRGTVNFIEFGYVIWIGAVC